MTTGICLGCRHFDAAPGFARDLDEQYGMCRWQMPELPNLGMLRASVGHASASTANRMIPKRGLEQRPDLWSSCPTFAPREPDA